MKADLASLFAIFKEFSKSDILCTNLIPFPPPPADAFIINGNPISLAIETASSSFTSPSVPGTKGTFADLAISREVILSPISLIASALGPIKSILFFTQFSANSAFSERKP